MENMSIAAFVALGAIFAAAAFVWHKRNLFRAIGGLTICSLTIATWNTISVGGVEFDVRVAVAAIALLCVTLFHPRWLFNRLTIADTVVAMICFWQTFSEWNATGQIIEPFALSYGYWALPYLVGRCSAQSVSDLRFLGYVISGVCLLFAVASLVETLTKVDMFEVVFGAKPSLEYRLRKAIRWGFIRCEGPHRHPIFFGIMLLLMFPWSVWLISNSQGKGRGLAAAGILSTVAATMSTISRGPILGLPVLFTIASIVRFKRLLAAVSLLAIIFVTVLALNPDYLVSGTQWFAKLNGEPEKAVIIGAELQVNSSSMSRLLVIQHYWKPVRHAGMIGYGMTATEGFPPNVPFIPIDKMTGKPYPLIDNSYVLLTLRGGWLECLGFLLLHAAALFQISRLAKSDRRLLSFSRLLCGAICTHALLVFTVYPDYDFMFVFMWTVGISSMRLGTTHLHIRQQTKRVKESA